MVFKVVFGFIIRNYLNSAIINQILEIQIFDVVVVAAVVVQ
jgi:hypothetical protein